MRNRKGIFISLAVCAVWLSVWQAAHLLVYAGMGTSLLLPSPAETFLRLRELLGEPSFYSIIGHTFLRIFTGFLLGTAVGCILGGLTAFSPLLYRFFALPMNAIKSTPVASFVILALFWTGAENLSIFISFIVVYPMIHVNTLAGLLSADPKLLEMARIFRVPVWKQAVYIYRGALYPYLKSVCRTALGMGLKSGIAAEVIGVPDGSIGEGLYLSKIYLDTADLFAWTITIILISVIFEKGILLLLYLAAGKEAEYDSVKTEN